VFVARKSIGSPIGVQKTHTVNKRFVVLARFAHVLISCQIEFSVNPNGDVIVKFSVDLNTNYVIIPPAPI